MFCRNCGTENSDQAQFCKRCGAGLLAPSSVSGQSFTGPVHSSGKAIASLICGIFGFVFPSAVAAIILGHISLSEIRKSAGRLTGHGMAMAGLILGYVGVSAIPFILIVAAIAIPNLLRSRMVANEASAVGLLKTVNVAALTYSSDYGNGFPPSMEALAGPNGVATSCDHARLIDKVLASGQKSGYVFTYVSRSSVRGTKRVLSLTAQQHGCTSPGSDEYWLTADPITRGTTGQRSFFTDQTGVIRFDARGAASGNSPPLQ
jgi:type IV pilus assembly protein PilA